MTCIAYLANTGPDIKGLRHWIVTQVLTHALRGTFRLQPHLPLLRLTAEIVTVDQRVLFLQNVLLVQQDDPNI